MKSVSCCSRRQRSWVSVRLEASVMSLGSASQIRLRVLGRTIGSLSRTCYTDAGSGPSPTWLFISQPRSAGPSADSLSRRGHAAQCPAGLLDDEREEGSQDTA